MLVLANNKIVELRSYSEKNGETMCVDTQDNLYNLSEIETEDNLINYLTFWLTYNEPDKPDFIPHATKYNINHIESKIQRDKIVYNIHLERPAIFIGLKGRVYNWFKAQLTEQLSVPVEINIIETNVLSYRYNSKSKLK